MLLLVNSPTLLIAPHTLSPADNDSEYITDLVTEADRMGRGSEFAQAYARCAQGGACRVCEGSGRAVG